MSKDANIITNNNNNEESCKAIECSKLGCPDDRCWSREPPVCQHRGTLDGCHPLCAGGCSQKNSARDCFACTAYILNGECIPECPSGL